MIMDINNIDPSLLEEDDRIVAYLKGKMSSEEEQQFLTELDENPELKEKAIVTARLVKGLKEVGAAQDKDIVGAFLASSEQGVKAVANRAIHLEEAAYSSAKISFEREQDRGSAQMESSTTKMAKTVSLRKTSIWLSIAASLIFVVWLGFEYNDYRSTIGLGEEYGDSFSSSLIIRGTDSTTEADKKLKSLFANVKDNKDLNNTIHELSLCWELSTMDTYNDYTDYSAEIGWNLAIAYLKDNDKKGATIVLERLVSLTDNNSAINKKAKELLLKIKGN